MAGLTTQWLHRAGDKWVQRFDVAIGDGAASAGPILDDDEFVRSYSFSDFTVMGPSLIYRHTLRMARSEVRSYFRGNREQELIRGEKYVEAQGVDPLPFDAFISIIRRAEELTPTPFLSNLVDVLCAEGATNCLAFQNQLYMSLIRIDSRVRDVGAIQLAGPRVLAILASACARLLDDNSVHVGGRVLADAVSQWGPLGILEVAATAYSRLNKNQHCYILSSSFEGSPDRLQPTPLTDLPVQLEQFYSAWDPDDRELMFGPKDEVWDAVAASGRGMMLARAVVSYGESIDELLISFASSTALPRSAWEREIRGWMSETYPDPDLVEIEFSNTHRVRFSAFNPDLFRISRKSGLERSAYRREFVDR